LDPLSPAANTTFAFMLVMTRDYDGAIKFGRKAVELNPKLTVALNNLGEAYIHKGMYDEALEVFRQLSEDDPLLGRQGLIRSRARAGDKKEARALFLQLRQSSDGRRLMPLDLASLHASLGETYKAFELLEQAHIGVAGLASLRFDPLWDELRSDPRFGAILNRGERPRSVSSSGK
jgi:tetratricopeptide (TPR) repeat protein